MGKKGVGSLKNEERKKEKVGFGKEADENRLFQIHPLPTSSLGVLFLFLSFVIVLLSMDKNTL